MSTLSLAGPTLRSLMIRITVRDQELATATGFLTAGPDRVPFLITNRHNLAGRNTETGEPLHASAATPDAVVIRHDAPNRVGQWVEVREPVIDDDGQPLWFEHPTLGRAVDVVALPLSTTRGFDGHGYGLPIAGPDVVLGVSRDVFVVGYPFGIITAGGFPIWTRGTIATELAFNFDDKPAFLIDARTRTGQSGSPVVHYDANSTSIMAGGRIEFRDGPTERLLGVYSGRVRPDSDLGVVWREEVILDIINARRRPRPD